MMINLVDVFETEGRRIRNVALKFHKIHQKLSILEDTWESHFPDNWQDPHPHTCPLDNNSCIHMRTSREGMVLGAKGPSFNKVLWLCPDRETDLVKVMPADNDEWVMKALFSEDQAIHIFTRWIGEIAVNATPENEQKLKAFVIDLQTALDAQAEQEPLQLPSFRTLALIREAEAAEPIKIPSFLRRDI